MPVAAAEYSEVMTTHRRSVLLVPVTAEWTGARRRLNAPTKTTSVRRVPAELAQVSLALLAAVPFLVLAFPLAFGLLQQPHVVCRIEDRATACARYAGGRALDRRNRYRGEPAERREHVGAVAVPRGDAGAGIGRDADKADLEQFRLEDPLPAARPLRVKRLGFFGSKPIDTPLRTPLLTRARTLSASGETPIGANSTLAASLSPSKPSAVAVPSEVFNKALWMT